MSTKLETMILVIYKQAQGQRWYVFLDEDN